MSTYPNSVLDEGFTATTLILQSSMYTSDSYDTEFESLQSILTDPNKELKEDDIPERNKVRIGIAILLSIMICLIAFGNSLVVLAVILERRLRTFENFFFASLAVADLSIALFVLPFTVTVEISGHWRYGYIACDLYIFTDVACCTASILHLCTIGLNRYWSITSPLKYATKQTCRRAIVMIAFVWLMSFIIACPPLFGWPRRSRVNTDQCDYDVNIVYVIYSSCGSFYIPLIVMTIVYIQIFKVSKKGARFRRMSSYQCINGKLEIPGSVNVSPHLEQRRLNRQYSPPDAGKLSLQRRMSHRENLQERKQAKLVALFCPRRFRRERLERRKSSESKTAKTLENGTLKGLGVLLPDMKEQLQSPTWVIGLCMVGTFGYILGLLATFLERKFGARICTMMSGLIATVGLLVCSLATNVHVLLIGMLMIGFLMLQLNIAFGILPRYFNKYYSVAVNIATLGASLSIVIVPIVVGIIEGIYGRRGTLLLVSGASLQLLVFGALMRYSEENESVKSVLLDTNDVKSFLCCSNIYASFLLNPTIVSCVIIPGIVDGFTWGGWLVHIVSFVVSTGASLRSATTVSTCGGLGIVTIRIILPFLDQTFSYRRLMLISSILMSITLLSTANFHSVVFLCIISFLFCIGKGMLTSEIYIAIKDIVKRDQHVSAISWYHLLYGFATMFGAFITGLLYDISGSYIVSFILLAVVSILAPIALVVEHVCFMK